MQLRLQKICKFILVGGITFVIYFVIQIICGNIGFGLISSVSIAYLFSVLFHYTTSHKFTFRSTNKITESKQFLRYIVVCFFSYLINLLVIKISINVGYTLHNGMVLGVILTTILGFYLSNFFIFKITIK